MADRPGAGAGVALVIAWLFADGAVDEFADDVDVPDVPLRLSDTRTTPKHADCCRSGQVVGREGGTLLSVTLDPVARPPLDLAGVLAALDRYRVRWILTGSLVLIAYGARFKPGDVDITPALDEDNLHALAAMADDLGAIPAHVPEWAECPPLDWHANWEPHPATVANLDHLLVTKVGMLDIVPSLCGHHDGLLKKATTMQVGSHQVLVADPATVLDRLDRTTRNKDKVRIREIDRVRRHVEHGTHRLTGLDHLVTR